MRRFCLGIVLGGISAIVGCERGSGTQTDDLRLLSLKSKCRDEGVKVFQEWKKTFFQDTFSDASEYTYNPALKTCLWLGEYYGPSFDRDKAGKLVPVQTHVKLIVDVYTNKPLIEFTAHGAEQIGDVSEKEFNAKRADLFQNARYST